MLRIRIKRDAGGHITQASVATEDTKWTPDCENRNDWKTFEDAEKVANALTATAGVGRYLATDAGGHVSPRYDVIEMPKVGDKVSYAFNGDSYPCGTIKSISAFPHRLITVDDGGCARKFWRRRLSGSWVMDQTWSLTPGHVSKTNPSF